MSLKERAKKLKTDIPAVFIAMRKKETPFIVKLLAAITVAYALSPIDLIPDFIPVLGFLDDVIILPMLIALIIKLLPKNILEQCRDEAENIWVDGKPKRWYYALPIVLLWLFLAAMFLRIIFSVSF